MAQNDFDCPMIDYSNYASTTDYDWYLNHDCPQSIQVLIQKSWLASGYCSQTTIACDSNSRITKMWVLILFIFILSFLFLFCFLFFVFCFLFFVFCFLFFVFCFLLFFVFLFSFFPSFGQLKKKKRNYNNAINLQTIPTEILALQALQEM